MPLTTDQVRLKHREFIMMMNVRFDELLHISQIGIPTNEGERSLIKACIYHVLSEITLHQLEAKKARESN